MGLGVKSDVEECEGCLNPQRFTTIKVNSFLLFFKLACIRFPVEESIQYNIFTLPATESNTELTQASKLLPSKLDRVPCFQETCHLKRVIRLISTWA
jgi:hypothetical protein